MKKLLFTAALLVGTGCAFAQGQLIFANSAAATITNALTGAPALGSAVANDTQVALYVGNVGDPVNSLNQIGSTTNCSSSGRFAGGTRTLPGWTGTVQVQVRCWLANTVYASYEAAQVAAQGGDYSVVLGASHPIIITLSLPPASPPSLTSGGLDPVILYPMAISPVQIGPGVSNVTTTSAVLYGRILDGDVGGGAILPAGAAYSVSSVNDNPFPGGPGVSTISVPLTHTPTNTAFNPAIVATITNLTPGTSYSFRTYGVNYYGTGFAAVVNFTTVGPSFALSRAVPNQIRLRWNYSPCTVELTTNLTPPRVWVDVTNAPAVSNGQYTLTLPMSTGQQFFRLRCP